MKPAGRIVQQKKRKGATIGTSPKNCRGRAPQARPGKPRANRVLDPQAENKSDRADEWRDRKFDRGSFTNPYQHAGEGEQQCHGDTNAEALHRTLDVRTVESE